MKVAKINQEDGKVLEILEVDDAAIGECVLLAPADVILGPESENVVVAGAWRWDGERFVELPFKAMLLGAGGILEAIEELPSSAHLRPNHVDLRPYGGDCDNEPGKYRWDAELEQLVPLGRFAQPSAAAGVSLEEALAQLLELNPQLKQGDKTMVWLAGYRASFDDMLRRRKK
jgi:hypothetical protein